MHIKGVIFDLDETLYDYKSADKIAYDHVTEYLIKLKKYDKIDVVATLFEAKKSVKNILSPVLSTSIHQRILYFQKIVEKLNLSYVEAKKINLMYWEKFYNNIVPREGVIDLFKYLKEQNIKIAVLTNFTTEHQFNKLDKLGLLKYIDVLVTSEEIGVEKPDKRSFQAIINKLKLSPDKLLMVGDDFKSDIEGAIESSIYAAYFNKNSEKVSMTSDHLTFNSFDQLLNLFKKLKEAINELHTLCNRYGQRFDLTQAGGGNISVKISFGDQTLLIIKASGYSLTDVSTDDGYVILNNNNISEKLLLKTVLRPSIETLMHSSLKSYTVHLHSIQAINILVKKNAKQLIEKFFPDSLFIDYFTPGEKLANIIKQKYNSERLIFLKNHGIILTSHCISDIEIILNKIDEILIDKIPIDLSHYKIVNLLSDKLEKVFKKKFVTFLIEDKIVLDLFIKRKTEIANYISTPDKLVYCGSTILTDINNLLLLPHPPSLISYNNQLFSVSDSLKKCKDIVDVFKAHLLFSSRDNQLLDSKEINFLQGWDAEKYRKNL